MKTILLSIIFQFASLLAICQIDSTSKSIVETILREQQPKGTLFYTDRIASEFLTRIAESLKRRKFIGQTSHTTFDTLELSKKEKKYLDSSVTGFYSCFWNDTLFKNSKRIPVDSMWARIKKQNYEFYKNKPVDTSGIGQYDSSHRLQIENANTFQFSPIIFFRRKSIFIFFFVRVCGGECGVDELSFYRLENGVYKKWFLIRGGVY